MEKHVAAISKQAFLTAFTALLLPILASGAEKTSYVSGNGLVAATWSPLAGTGTIVSDGTNLIVGTGTAFLAELAVGSTIRVDGDSIGTVASISDDATLNLAAPTYSGFGDWPFTHQTVPFPADNVTIAAGHEVSISGAPGITIHDLTIDATAVLTSDCPAVNITGNLLVNGTFIQETGCRLIMNGAASTIGGSPTPVTIRSLRVTTTTPPAVVTLTVPVVVTDLLDMQNGTIELNGQTLTLGRDATNVGMLLLHDGNYAYINGSGTLTRWLPAVSIPIANAAGAFPLTAAGINRNVWIGGEVSQAGTVSVTQTEVSGTTPITLYENSTTFDKRMNLSWDVAIGNGLLAAPVNLRIQASGIAGVTTLTDLTMSGATNPANGTYEPTTGTLTDPQVNRISLADQDALVGTYYVAATPGSPMPVELASFTAAAKGRAIVLQWKTATEKNNFGFDIERRAATSASSPSAIWTKIGFAEGNGTTNTPHSYTFADNTVGGSYAYRLKQIDRDGRSEYSAVVEAVLAMSASDYSLTQNYPNPFNPATTIHFMLKATQHATVTVYNALGQEVATLFDGVAEGNTMQAVVFDASRLSSGMYFYTLRSNEKFEVKKMQLLR